MGLTKEQREAREARKKVEEAEKAAYYERKREEREAAKLAERAANPVYAMTIEERMTEAAEALAEARRGITRFERFMKAHFDLFEEGPLTRPEEATFEHGVGELAYGLWEMQRSRFRLRKKAAEQATWAADRALQAARYIAASPDLGERFYTSDLKSIVSNMDAAFDAEAKAEALTDAASWMKGALRHLRLDAPAPVATEEAVPVPEA